MIDNVYHRSAGGRSTTAASARAITADCIEPNIRELLDHIAVELAEEYVRLMEAAAEADPRAGRWKEEP